MNYSENSGLVVGNFHQICGSGGGGGGLGISRAKLLATHREVDRGHDRGQGRGHRILEHGRQLLAEGDLHLEHARGDVGLGRAREDGEVGEELVEEELLVHVALEAVEGGQQAGDGHEGVDVRLVLAIVVGGEEVV